MGGKWVVSVINSHPWAASRKPMPSWHKTGMFLNLIMARQHTKVVVFLRLFLKQNGKLKKSRSFITNNAFFVWTALFRIQLILMFDRPRLLNNFILYMFAYPALLISLGIVQSIAPVSVNVVHDTTHVGTPLLPIGSDIFLLSFLRHETWFRFACFRLNTVLQLLLLFVSFLCKSTITRYTQPFQTDIEWNITVTKFVFRPSFHSYRNTWMFKKVRRSQWNPHIFFLKQIRVKEKNSNCWQP